MSVQYTGGCSVHWGMSLNTLVVFSTVGDIMSTTGVFSAVRDIMSTAGGFGTLGVTMNMLVDTMSSMGDIISTPGDVQYINDFPMTSHHIYRDTPCVLMISPSVLNAPQCTHDISHCTHDIPPVYCTPPPSPRCTAQTLCRVRLKT